MTNEEYIEEFIQLTSYKIDYSSKKDIRKNNRDAKKLIKMRNIIKNNREMFMEVYCFLLKSDNKKVQVSAAVDCLNSDVYIEEALEILNEVSQEVNSDELDERLTAFSAEMALRIYNGEFPGKKL